MKKYLEKCKINNIKYSFKVDPKALKSTCVCNVIRKKKHLNFCIYKNKYTYVVFLSGHINVCKIRNFEEVKSSYNNFLEHMNISENSVTKHYKVENVCCNGIIIKVPNFTLRRLYHFLTSNSVKNQYYRYNAEIFPALYISTNNVKGKILIFSSGKFIIVGSNNYKCLQTQMYILNAHIYAFYQTTMREMLCAQNVEKY